MTNTEKLFNELRDCEKLIFFGKLSEEQRENEMERFNELFKLLTREERDRYRKNLLARGKAVD